MSKKWQGNKPSKCDICKNDIRDEFIDGVTYMGPWGIMCPRCHINVGRGLGTGCGQKYKKNGQYFEKIAG